MACKAQDDQMVHLGVSYLLGALTLKWASKRYREYRDRQFWMNGEGTAE